MIKGRKIVLTPEYLTEVIGCLNEGVQRYFSHKEVLYEGYIRDQAIWELMGGKQEAMDVLKMEVSTRVMLSATTQMVVPKARKSNVSTHLGTFYCWAVLHGIPLNLPFILLNHMRTILNNKKSELPYGFVITALGKQRNMIIEVYTMHLRLFKKRMEEDSYKIWGSS